MVTTARNHLATFAWEHGPVGLGLRLRPLRSYLGPERLGVFLTALAERRGMAGAILEVGCFRGGTAVRACELLRLWQDQRQYTCIDTFCGFVPEQFATDRELGTPPSFRTMFACNSRRTVERTLRHLGHAAKVIEGDIAALPDASLPSPVSVCLLDVDLAVPTLEGLRRLRPRLEPGGVILVDDCEDGETTGWHGAGQGYREFVAEVGLPERYQAGLGIIEAAEPASDVDSAE